MKSVRRSTLLQGGLLALALLGAGYFAWQRYHPPAPRTYEGKTLDQWIEDLDDPNYQTSRRAADVLADAGAESVPVLLDACQQGEIRLHRRAAAVLVRIGGPAAPALAAALKDKARQQRIEVALVRLGSAAVPALREALTEEKSGEAAAHVLGLIGPRAADAVPDLIALLNRRQAVAALRSEAAFALGRIGEPAGDIVPALIAALADSKKDVREQAADALGWIGSPAGTNPAVRPALTAALKDEEAKVALKACQALSFIGDAEAAPALLAAFQGGRAAIVLEAGRALWRLGPKNEPAIPALLSAAQGLIDKSAPARALLASFGPRVVPVLVKALRDDEAARREAAADILGRIGPPARPAVPALLAALKDKSSSVALMAAMALAEIDPTRGGAAVPLLADSVDVPGATVALAKIGPDARAAVPALIAALKPGKGNVQQELMRLNARLALARIGTPAVPALIEALKDKREGVALLAGEALGWVLPPPKQAVPALCAAVKNDRAHAAVYAHALGLLGPPARSAAPELTELLTDAASRAEAAVALVRIDPQQADKAVPPLIKDLEAEDEKQRQAAVLALARLGPAAQPTVDALTALLRDRLLMKIEIEALGEVWAQAIPGLVGLLKSPHAEVRQRAVLALGQIGPAARAALTPLIAALSDRDSAVRIDAAQILQALGAEASEAVPALIANLREPQMEVRAVAAAVLGHIEAGAKEARQPLLECLLDPDEQVRYAAALSLGRIDSHFTEAAPALRDALNDSAAMVQLAAIDSLSHIEPAAAKDAGPILVALSRKPYPLDVRFRAVEGMTNLLGPDEAKIAEPWLTIELTDAVPNDRLYAARLLANIDHRLTSDLVLALAAGLSTPFTDRRPAILKTLGEFGPKAREAVPEIELQLYEGASGVRPQAIRALRAINPARLKQLGIN
ncbi:MAG TPA: HEAT repeat domain-containing protein [Gemmataceae bacterium]|nr:HEAT repeat domain-containing protein [Gemmataceae bacterium]